MKVINSYIFFKRKEKDKSKKATKSGNLGKITLPPSFYTLLKNTFDNVEELTDLAIGSQITKGKFCVTYNGDNVSVEYVYQFVYSTCYLNLMVNLSEKKSVEILDVINSRLTNPNSAFEKHYISIISYDSVSKYYCNKLYPFFNEFERKLRELLFLIYTTRFSLDYYLATTSQDLQRKIKEGSAIIRKDFRNYPKDDADIKYAFYSLTYSDIENLLFSKHTSEDNQDYIKNLLENTKDLSSLSDKELRQSLEKGILKSDWENFFGDKIFDDFKTILNTLREFRNNVAHCKFVTKEQYDKCIKILKSTIKTIDKAILLTKKNDFKAKNMSSVCDSISAFLNSFIDIMTPIIENIYTSTESLSGISEIVSSLSKINAFKLSYTNKMTENESEQLNIENESDDNDLENDTDDSNDC